MSSGTGKCIIIGVCGGIAAYKAAHIVSGLRQNGFQVYVIMTQAATRFVQPLTFRTLSGQPVFVDMFSEPRDWNVEHVELARRADLLLVVPATANIIGKMAHGIADDLLSTTVLATRGQVMIAPAMNVNMFRNPVVQENLAALRERGVWVIPPERGLLACGDEGEGRLPEPGRILETVLGYFKSTGPLAGRKILVTAGPTREHLDPVRYLSNPSTGTMGYALAEAAWQMGAEVRLVSGPTHLPPPPGVRVEYVTSAREMREAVFQNFDWCEVLVKAAAVADYRPETSSQHKLKKTGENLVVNLVRNPDILKEAGEKKGDKVLVGFAAETHDLIENAERKMREKNLDLVVANNISEPGAGFGPGTNRVKLVWPGGVVEELPMMSKLALARRVLECVAHIWQNRQPSPDE